MVQLLNWRTKASVEKRDYNCQQSSYRQGGDLYCSSLIRLLDCEPYIMPDSYTGKNNEIHLLVNDLLVNRTILRVTNDFQILDKIPNNGQLVDVYIHVNSTPSQSPFVSFSLYDNIEELSTVQSNDLSPAYLGGAVGILCIVIAITFLIVAILIGWQMKLKQLKSYHFLSDILINSNGVQVKRDGSLLV